MSKKQRPLIVAAILLIVVLLGGFTVWKRAKSETSSTEETTEKKRRLSLPEVSYEEGPYVILSPIDIHNVRIAVHSVKKAASDMEYELEYQSGSLLQGAFGQLDISSLPVDADILLGSRSAGGATTYHENVTGGSLLGRFTGEDDYQKKGDWRFIDNSKKETEFSSKDAKFQISSKDLASERVLIIFESLGYPEGVPGSVDSKPYVISGTSKLSGKAELTIRADSEDANKIVGYDGDTWHEFETQKDGKTLTATVDLMQLYLAVK